MGWSVCGPIRNIADIEALERIPLEQQITCWNINEWMRRGRTARPDKTAIQYFSAGDPTEMPLTVIYRDLEARINRTANFLRASGVQPDRPVAFMLPLIPDAYTVLGASMAAGIACCINPMLRPDHLVDLVRRTGTDILIAAGPAAGFDIWERAQAVAAQVPGLRLFSVAPPGTAPLASTDLAALAAPYPADRLSFTDPRSADDIVAYVHSGGTTAVPKFVQLTNRGFVHKCWSLTMTMAHTADDVEFCDMPLFHIAGFLSRIVLPMVHGMSVIIPSPHGARDKAFIANYWKFVECCRVSVLHAVPTILGQLAQNPPQGEDVSSLRRYGTTGSTALAVDVAESIAAHVGVNLLATYGATEFTQNVSQGPRDGDPRFGSAGIRNPFTEIKIVHLDGSGRIMREAATNEIGSVIVHSPGNTPGYLRMERDPAVFMPDGWINNGDLGRIDADGYLWLTGRAKDFIIRSGHNIYPNQIEEALLRHPAVAVAAAVAKPDSYAGELPVAYVQLAHGKTATAGELKAFARERVAELAAAPDEIFIVDEIPLTDVRKIAKADLRLDAARRTFERILQEKLEVPVDVRVTPDAVHGTLTTIDLGAAGRARPGLVDEARAVMKNYPIYSIVL